MEIIYKQNNYIHTIRCKLNKTSEVVALLEGLNYEVLKIARDK